RSTVAVQLKRADDRNKIAHLKRHFRIRILRERIVDGWRVARGVHGVNGADGTGFVARTIDFRALWIVKSAEVWISRTRTGDAVGQRSRPRSRSYARDAHRIPRLRADRRVALVRGKADVRRLAGGVAAFVPQVAVQVSDLDGGIIDLHAIAVD